MAWRASGSDEILMAPPERGRRPHCEASARCESGARSESIVECCCEHEPQYPSHPGPSGAGQTCEWRRDSEEDSGSLSAAAGLLVVIDGAKALARAVHKVFGDQALIQRCTLHKRRKVADHLPESERVRGRPARGPGVQPHRRRRRAAPDPRPRPPTRGALARRRGQPAGGARRHVHRAPSRRWRPVGPNAHVDHPIESMISVGKTTTRNLKRWRDGTMIKRWMAAGMPPPS
jgi:hypothetical protein